MENNELVHVIRYNGSEFVEKEPYVPLSDLLEIANSLAYVLRGGEEYADCWNKLESTLNKYGYVIDSDGFVRAKEELE